MPTPPVVILRSNDICFQGIIRSFGSAEIPCISIIFDWQNSKPWLSEKSKYFDEHYTITNPAQDPNQAFNELLKIGEKLFHKYKQKLFLIPSSDTNMALIDIDANKLEEYFLFIGEKEFTKFRSDVFNKEKTFQALSNNTSIPQTFSCKDKDDIPYICKQIKYPCVFKPAQKDFSQSFYSKHKGLKAVEADNSLNLATALESEMLDGTEVIVQEKILFNGPEDEIPFYIYADKNHNIQMAVSAVKERIDPYPFGTATVLRLNYIEELLKPAQQIVKTMKWRGLLMIEFIKDQKDNQWKVIELNGRPWLLIDFFRRSGFPFLKMLYQDYYYGLNESDQLLHPRWETNDSPVHFELSSLNSVFNFRNIDDIKKLIDQYPGRKSFYYLDPNDLEPAEFEFANFTNFNEDKSHYFNFLRGESCEF